MVIANCPHCSNEIEAQGEDYQIDDQYNCICLYCNKVFYSFSKTEPVITQELPKIHTRKRHGRTSVVGFGGGIIPNLMNKSGIEIADQLNMC